MILRRLIQQGFTRFTQRVELDLTGLPPGLIAVRGANGEGKTTIMELLGPGGLFLELPSRPGPLYDHTNRRDAFFELEIDHADHTWRIVVQADSGTEKTPGTVEAFLYRDGEPLNNGKGGTFREQVARYFPRRDVFLASVYAAQSGAGSFHRLDVKERRELFVELLGLGHLKALAARAKAHADALDGTLVDIGERLAGLLEQEAEALTLDRQVLELRAELEAAVERHTAARGELEAAVVLEAARRAVLDQLEAARTLAEATHRRLEARINRRADELEDLNRKIAADGEIVGKADTIRAEAAELVTLRARRQELGAKWTAADLAYGAAVKRRNILTGDLATAERDLSRARGDLAELVTLAKLVTELAPAEGQRQALEARRVEAAARSATARTATETARRAHRELERRAGQGLERARAALEADTTAAGLLDGVPCGGLPLLEPDPAAGPGVFLRERECGSCRFLSSARAAAAGLEARRAAVTAAELEAGEGAELWAEVQVATAQEDLARRALERVDTEARPLDAQLVELRAARARLERRADVEALILELEARRLAVVTEAGELDLQVPERLAARDELRADGLAVKARILELDGADQRLQALEVSAARLPDREASRTAAREDLANARAELAEVKIPPAPAEASRAVQEAAAALEGVRARVTAAAELEGAVRGRLGAAEGRRQVLGDLEIRRRALEARRDVAARRRAGFRLVAAAVGVNGIQALEIDAAGPSIGTLTNQLIAACYGPRFRIELRTIQEAEAGRKQRETFDLRVLDGDRAGGARDLSDLSGGEQVLIDEAVKLGIALFNARRSGAPVLTLWRDECDGKLDPENARRYPVMLRRALELGGFHHVLFVSHRPDVAAQADAWIDVSGGTARAVVR